MAEEVLLLPLVFFCFFFAGAAADAAFGFGVAATRGFGRLIAAVNVGSCGSFGPVM